VRASKVGAAHMFGLIFLALVFGMPPLFAWLHYRDHERTSQVWWRERVIPQTVNESAAYRASAMVGGGYLQHAHNEVRWAALSSLLLGSMAVPGLLLGLVGIVAGGVGITSVPGLMVAVALWRCAAPLLSGKQEGAEQAARAARWSLRLNWLILVLCLGFLAVAAIKHGDSVIALLTGFVASYALLSMAQAVLVCKAAVRVAQELGADAELRVYHALPFYLRRKLGARAPVLAGDVRVASDDDLRGSPFEPLPAARVALLAGDEFGTMHERQNQEVL
jgi:hypothetical protein